MRVKIVSCKQTHWWYVDQIGEIFQVKPFMDSGRYIVDDGGEEPEENQLPNQYLIDPEDCVGMADD